MALVGLLVFVETKPVDPVNQGEQSNEITIQESSATPDISRDKRAIVFRPLFVYRQQQIRKQRVAAIRKRVGRSVDAVNGDVQEYASNGPENTPPKLARDKRAIIFRPLFVYRQQQVEKRRVLAARRYTTSSPIRVPVQQGQRNYYGK